MAWKEAVTDNEKLKNERKAAMMAALSGNKLPDEEGSDDEDNTGLISSHVPGTNRDDEDEEESEWEKYQKKSNEYKDQFDDEDEDEKSDPEPIERESKLVAKVVKSEDLEDDEYKRDLRIRNAQLQAQIDADRLERQQVLEEVRRLTQQQAQATRDPDAPELPWVEKQDLQAFEEKINKQGAAVTGILLQQERQLLDRAIADIKAEHPHFDQYFPPEAIETMWKGYAQDPVKAATKWAPSGFNQNWKHELLTAFRQKDYDRLASERAKEQKKEDQLAKKREEKREVNAKNQGKIPRSGQAYQEPQSKALPKAKRDFRSLRNPVIEFLAQGG